MWLRRREPYRWPSGNRRGATRGAKPQGAHASGHPKDPSFNQKTFDSMGFGRRDRIPAHLHSRTTISPQLKFSASACALLPEHPWTFTAPESWLAPPAPERASPPPPVPGMSQSPHPHPALPTRSSSPLQTSPVLSPSLTPTGHLLLMGRVHSLLCMHLASWYWIIDPGLSRNTPVEALLHWFSVL